MKVINFLALILVLIGALNWGLWGFFQFDFIAWLCGGTASGLSRLIYTLIGLSGLWGLKFLGHCKALCGNSNDSCGPHDPPQQ